MNRRAALLVSALTALLVVLAPSAPAWARARKPVITYVTPMRVSVGGRLTLRGRGFSRRRSRNTLIFRGPNRRFLFVKPTRASARRLVVVVPWNIQRLLNVTNGSRRPTRLRMRVAVRRRFGRWTLGRTSPVVVPFGSTSGGTSGGSSPLPAEAACGSGNDWDGDLLSNAIELQIGTDPCNTDTDADGVQDGFEYKSAIDLNDDDYQDPQSSLPYPGKRPYPNPLDPTDASKDYDGDSLTSSEEQTLWNYTIAHGTARTLFPLSYSAGEKYSVSVRGGDGRRHPTLAAAGYSKQQDFLNWAASAGYGQVMLKTGPPWFPSYDGVHQGLFDLLDVNRDGVVSARESVYYDLDRDGYLSDNERDEDADGLPNWAERHGPTSHASWWTSCYKDAGEKAYPVDYAGTDFVNPDTDGDGVRDGADDQDHDDVPNVMELSRLAAFNKHGDVYPNDPLEGSGDDRQSGETCRVSKTISEIVSGLDPKVWHQSAYGRVDPFNPCLPDPQSRTCPEFIDFGTTFAPFDDSVDWYALN
jgi:hypothetical protein